MWNPEPYENNWSEYTAKHPPYRQPLVENDFEQRGDICGVLLHSFKAEEQGLVALFDASLLWLMRMYWWIPGNGRAAKDGHYYARSKDAYGKVVQMHRLVMDAPDGMLVDHINHDTLDNRRQNLRIVSSRQNNHNLSNQSRYGIGVTRISRGRRFSAAITVSGKSHGLGTYSTPELAQAAYNLALSIIEPNVPQPNPVASMSLEDLTSEAARLWLTGLVPHQATFARVMMRRSRSS
jgi:HNH endonuclease